MAQTRVPSVSGPQSVTETFNLSAGGTETWYTDLQPGELRYVTAVSHDGLNVYLGSTGNGDAHYRLLYIPGPDGDQVAVEVNAASGSPSDQTITVTVASSVAAGEMGWWL